MLSVIVRFIVQNVAEWGDALKPNTIRRAVMYCLLLFAVLTVQNSFLSRLTLFGTRAMIVPLAAAACGFFEGGEWGGFYGLTAGILYGLGGNTVLYTVLFTAIGFFSGMASHFFVNDKLLPFLFVVAIALLVTGLCQMLRPVIFLGTALSVALQVALKQALISIPFAVVIYPPFRVIANTKEIQ